MFLLIPDSRRLRIIILAYLHSTMFLLIRIIFHVLYVLLLFTFHNVSINSRRSCGRSRSFTTFTFHNVSINSRKYGYVLACTLKFTFHNVSINSTEQTWRSRELHKFTFHNVSINSNTKKHAGNQQFNLHSTMFLLIQKKAYHQQEIK